MQHAKSNNTLCEQDLLDENIHEVHLSHLQRNAESWRELEQGTSSTSPTVDQLDDQDSPGVDDPFVTSTGTGMNSPFHSSNDTSREIPSLFTPRSPSYSEERPAPETTHAESPPQSTHHDTSRVNRNKWKSVDDITKEEEIASLSVLELKQILTANFIDYKGCCEKKELIDKVKMLYNQTTLSETCPSAEGESYERDVCKICMDRMIDCVLLDCGHLVACVKCGKRLNECPICRSLVVRVVHIFRV